LNVQNIFSRSKRKLLYLRPNFYTIHNYFLSPHEWMSKLAILRNKRQNKTLFYHSSFLCLFQHAYKASLSCDRILKSLSDTFPFRRLLLFVIIDNIVKIDSRTRSFCLCHYVQNSLSCSGEETQLALCTKWRQAKIWRQRSRTK